MNGPLPDWLNAFDTAAFLKVNGFHGPTGDFLFKWLTFKYSWIPLYAWLLYVLIRQQHLRTILTVIATVVLITTSDQISTGLKEWTQRPRPCHEPALKGQVHLVDGKCGGQYGFVSSHAANTMALAIFLGSLLAERRKSLGIIFLLYVAFNGYSRVYLGAHYPIDVIGGWLLGAVLALGAVRLYAFLPPNLLSRNKNSHG
jgi:undecaprenyl-diphosphatase